MNKDEPTIGQIERVLNYLSEFKSDISVLQEVSTRTEVKVDKINSSVEKIQEWRIKHETEMNMLKRSIKWFVIPILVILTGAWLKTALNI